MLASHLHSSVIGHATLEDSLAFILANKLSSATLLPTNVMQMISAAYADEPVRGPRHCAAWAGSSQTSNQTL